MQRFGTDTYAVKCAAGKLSDMIGRYVDLRPAGNEMAGCCPFHDDSTPSFYVSDAKGVYHCFGCGASGDGIDFFMRREKLSFLEAVSRMQYETPGSTRRIVEDNPSSKNSEAAARIWEGCTDIEGTPAESYLASRGLIGDWLPDTPLPLGYARLSFKGSQELHPTLVAAVCTAGGSLAGIQRTYLTENGDKLDPKGSKLSLGNIKRNAIQIGPPSERIAICEGLEDGLTLARVGMSVWVAAGAGMMKSIALPSVCRHVVIGADNDDAGRRAALEAARYYSYHGREVTIMRPPPEFKDFNHMHIVGVREALRGIGELPGDVA